MHLGQLSWFSRCMPLPGSGSLQGGQDMDGIRELVKSLNSSTWRLVMVGTEQMTRAVALPITGVLANLGEPFKAVASRVDDQISNAFQTTIRIGDAVQRQ